MPLNKVDIGQQILSSLLNYCILFQDRMNISKKIKYGRYIIKVYYDTLDYIRLFNRTSDYRVLLKTEEDNSLQNNSVTGWRELNTRMRKRALKILNYRVMYVYFRGKLDFYKDFSMYYIFGLDDEGKYRLRSIHENQYHNELIPYWTSIYGIPLDHNKIHAMIYDAMNLAFGWKNEWKKIQKLFTAIEMAKIKEV